MSRVPARPALLLLLLATSAIMLHGVCSGAVAITPSEMLHALGAAIAGGAGTVDPTTRVVLFELRIPRVLLGLLVGATLAASGVMMQGLFRNPLADPGLVGVSSGAALGAVLVIVISGGGGLAAPHAPWLLPLASLAGAWLVTWLILALGTLRGSLAIATVLLAGIAINALSQSVIGLCMFLADDEQLRSLNFWLLGSLGAAGWGSLAAAAPLCLAMLVAAPLSARALNAYSLGEAEAGHLGFRADRLKLAVILLTAAGVGGCVAQTGIIGFVGLVVPHIFRLIVGPDHRALLPGAALLGGALLVAADTLARTLAAPAELPIGIVTAACGAPFFLILLLRQKRRLTWL